MAIKLAARFDTDKEDDFYRVKQKKSNTVSQLAKQQLVNTVISKLGRLSSPLLFSN